MRLRLHGAVAWEGHCLYLFILLTTVGLETNTWAEAPPTTPLTGIESNACTENSDLLNQDLFSPENNKGEGIEVENKEEKVKKLKTIDKACSRCEGGYFKEKSISSSHFSTIQSLVRRVYEALENSMLYPEYTSHRTQYQGNIKSLKEHYQQYINDPDNYCNEDFILKKWLKKIMERMGEAKVLDLPDKI